MSNNRTRIELRLTQEEKDFIVNKAKDEGFLTTTAFIKASTKRFVSLNIDTSDYRDLVNETRKIGRNINSLIRDIRYSSTFSDIDIRRLESSMKNIEFILKEEKNEFKLLSDSFEKLPLHKLKKLFESNNLDSPLELIFDHAIEMIKDNLLFIIELMRGLRWKENEIELIYIFIYNLLPDLYNEEELLAINDSVYKYVREIKNKNINSNYKFSKREFVDLMNIINEHEKYHD